MNRWNINIFFLVLAINWFFFTNKVRQLENKLNLAIFIISSILPFFSFFIEGKWNFWEFQIRSLYKISHLLVLEQNTYHKNLTLNTLRNLYPNQWLTDANGGTITCRQEPKVRRGSAKGPLRVRQWSAKSLPRVHQGSAKGPPRVRRGSAEGPLRVHRGSTEGPPRFRLGSPEVPLRTHWEPTRAEGRPTWRPTEDPRSFSSKTLGVTLSYTVMGLWIC